MLDMECAVVTEWVVGRTETHKQNYAFIWETACILTEHMDSLYRGGAYTNDCHVHCACLLQEAHIHYKYEHLTFSTLVPIVPLVTSTSTHHFNKVCTETILKATEPLLLRTQEHFVSLQIPLVAHFKPPISK